METEKDRAKISRIVREFLNVNVVVCKNCRDQLR